MFDYLRQLSLTFLDNYLMLSSTTIIGKSLKTISSNYLRLSQSKKECLSKKKGGPKNVLVRKNFCPKKMFGLIKFFGLKKKFCPKKFLV